MIGASPTAPCRCRLVGGSSSRSIGGAATMRMAGSGPQLTDIPSRTGAAPTWARATSPSTASWPPCCIRARGCLPINGSMTFRCGAEFPRRHLEASALASSRLWTHRRLSCTDRAPARSSHLVVDHPHCAAGAERVYAQHVRVPAGMDPAHGCLAVVAQVEHLDTIHGHCSAIGTGTILAGAIEHSLAYE